MIQFFEKNKKCSSVETVYENTVVSKQKNTNITRDNISIFMLCQIPSISHVTAAILMDKYKHISVLIEEMKNPNVLEEFEYMNPKTNKPKKLNKNVIQKLNEYLK